MAQEFGLQVFGVSGGIVQESTYNPAFIHQSDVIQISGNSGAIPYHYAAGNIVYMHIEGVDNYDPVVKQGGFTLHIPTSLPYVIPTSRGQNPNFVYWEHPPFTIFYAKNNAARAVITEVNRRLAEAIISVRLMVNTTTRVEDAQ